MPWREQPDEELFQELLNHMDIRYERFDAGASAFCPACACPPFRPHARDCERRATHVDEWARFHERTRA